MSDNAAAMLRQYIERAERLLEERKGISDDIRDVFAEAKSQGFDPAIMKEMIKRRAMDRQKLAEREALIETYRSEEHTSELQSLMRISYAVCCLKKKTNNDTHETNMS